MRKKLLFLTFSVWAAVVLYFFSKKFPLKISGITDYFSVLPHIFNLKRFLAYLVVSLGDIFLAVFLLVVAYIIGRRIAAPLKKNLDTPGFFAVSAGTGFSVVAGFIFLLAAGGLLYEAVVYVVFIIFCVYALLELRREPAGLRFQPKKYDVTEKVLLLLLCLAGLLNLFCVLTPETYIDSLLYHLAVPQAYLQYHSFVKLPYNIFASFPQNADLLYLGGLVLNGPITAKLINFLFGLLLVAAVYSFGKKYTGRTAGLLAALLFYTLPVVSANLVNTQIDCLLTFYIFLAFYILVTACDSGFKSTALALAGLFAGFALGMKYSAVIFVPGLLLVLLYALFKKKALKKTAPVFAVFSIFSLIPVVPWLFKNYIYWGNPFYPYLSGNPKLAMLFSEQVGPAIAGIKGFFLLPWKLTMSLPFATMNIGPAFLLLLPFFLWLLLFKRREKYFYYALLIAFLAALIFWLPVTRIARFFLPGLLLFSLLLAYAVMKFIKDAKDDYYSFALIFVAAFIALNNIVWVAGIHFRNMDPLSYASGKLSKEQYLSRARPTYPNPYFALIHNIHKLPGNTGKILFVGETRSFYCSKPVIAGSVFDKVPLMEFAARGQNEDGLKQVLKKEGVSYVLVNYGELNRNQKTYGLASTVEYFKSEEFASALTFVAEAGSCRLFLVKE